ncbi:hypothetical protein HOLleu_15203 [Holothuria leucospilota]|uniref:Uncharacterized protein n=1 Tax=Holothuria leucospilota TaxID=206669 RepID=A0A9Q1C8U4_HOLLE|nr:hypothetical protein HOLleu_15203 [Holothuria leucospilota]
MSSTTKDASDAGLESAYVGVVILFAGVIGGLALIVGIMYFCQYCVKRRKRSSLRLPNFFILLTCESDYKLNKEKSNSCLSIEDGQLFSALQETAPERHVRGEEGSQYGDDLMEIERGEKTPLTRPPTCKLMDFADDELDMQSVSAAGTPTRSIGRTSYPRTPTLSERDGKNGRDFDQRSEGGRSTLELRGFPDGRRSKSPRSPMGLSEVRGHGSGESMTLTGSRTSLEANRVRAQVHHRKTEEENKLTKEVHQKSPPVKEATDSETDIDLIVKQEKERKQLDGESDSADDRAKAISRSIIQFKTIGQLALLRVPKKSSSPNDQNQVTNAPLHVKEKSLKPTEIVAENKHNTEQVNLDNKERVSNGTGPRHPVAYADLWQLRATLESKDSSEASESSEYETVISCRNTEDVPGMEKVSPSRTESFDVTDEDSCKFISTSFEQTISSVSAEESDTSERDRNSAESGKESIRSLKQMQGDSGYASIEQKAEMLTERLDWKRRQQFAAASDHDSTSFESAHSHSMTISSDSSSPTTDKTSQDLANSNSNHHDSKTQNSKGTWVRGGRRTASTKRREFTSEKKEAIFDSFSFPEEEAENHDTTDSSKDAMARASSTETYQFEARPKFRERVRRGGPSGMQRSHRESRLSCYPKGRDFSIDEKTDALFKEFLRQDAMFDTPGCKRSRPYNRQRWHPPSKQHSDSVLECSEKEPAAWRAEDHRSSSLDQRGGNGESAKQRLTELLPRSQSRGKLVPQDSVEEDALRSENRRTNDSKRPPRLREIQSKSHQTTTTADIHALTIPHKDLRRANTEKTERELLRLDDVSSRPSAFRPVKKTLPPRSATVGSVHESYSRSDETHKCEKEGQYPDDLHRRRDRSPIVPPTILVGRCKTPEKQASPTQQRSKSVSPRAVSPYRDERDTREDPSAGRSPKRSYSPRRFDIIKDVIDPKHPPFRRGSQPSQSPPTGRRVEEGGHVSRRDRSASMQETGLLQVPRSRSGSRSQGGSPRPRHRKRDIPDELCPDYEFDSERRHINRSLELLERTRHELEKERTYRDHPVTPQMKREFSGEMRRSPRPVDHDFDDRRRRERDREKSNGGERNTISPSHLALDRDLLQRLSPQGRDYEELRLSRDMDRNRDHLQRPRSREPSRSPIRHRERFIHEGRAGSETALLERRGRGENGRKQMPRYPLRAQSTGDVLNDERRRNASKNW